MSHVSDLIATDIDRYLESHEKKGLLRFITCGSVDDGKSTLIGRLLYESKLLYEDQLAALEADSKKFGTQGGDLDFALLMDGLTAEREQGITIDVAYRFLADDDVHALMVFLRGRTDAKINETFRYSHSFSTAVVDGQRLASRYNCTGCHVIDGRGGDIRRLYEKKPTEAPPNLLGEGAKVQAPWLYDFLKAPTPIRPWLSVRMPTFGFDDHETATAVQYFAGLDMVDSPFTYVNVHDYVGANVEARKLLASQDYLACFSCHVRGDQLPEGEKDSWAPDLAMGAEHPSCGDSRG